MEEHRVKVKVTPSEYFNSVKSRKQSVTPDSLMQLRNNCIELIDEFQQSGQTAAAKKILFHLDTLEKENQLYNLGIDTYIYKSDVDDYLDSVQDRAVKIIELENYTRRIPTDIIRKIESVRGIFDKMYVVFTDYTKKEERKIAAVRREQDPILFGTFQNKDTLTIIERFYFIGDWVDEYCDLTLDKMVSEIKSKVHSDPLFKLNPKLDFNELRRQLANITPTNNGLYREPVQEIRPESFWGRLKNGFIAFRKELKR